MRDISIHPARNQYGNYPKDTSKPSKNRPGYMKRVKAYDARMRAWEGMDNKVKATMRKPGSWKP